MVARLTTPAEMAPRSKGFGRLPLDAFDISTILAPGKKSAAHLSAPDSRPPDTACLQVTPRTPEIA